MTWLDLDSSIAEAERRLPRRPSGRRRRADAGRSRMPVMVAEALTRILAGHDRPPMREVRSELAVFCADLGERVPARATIYRFMAVGPPNQYRIADLPGAVQDCLYNLDPNGTVPGHQLVYYAFHYGDTAAMSFAAGLPWLDLYRARHMRGWRPRTRGVFEAVLRRRRILGRGR